MWSPTLIDEIGYLSYDTRYADLLFEVVSRRYQHQSIVLTTNRIFTEWNEIFPNAACCVTLVDRLVHRAELLQLDGKSYRAKEAKERAAKREKARKTTKRKEPPHV
jgi:DNA replication protein DnaC